MIGLICLKYINLQSTLSVQLKKKRNFLLLKLSAVASLLCFFPLKLIKYLKTFLNHQIPIEVKKDEIFQTLDLLRKSL